MARTVALSVLRGRVRESGDFGPDTTTGRYPNARINKELNASWARARELANLEGDGQMYLTQTSPTTMTSGAINASSSFGSVPWPASAVSVHGIDVVRAANDIYSLTIVPFGDRNTFRDMYGGVTGPPQGFFVLTVGTESGATVSAGSIGIVPAPDRGYSYTIWYLPVWVDLTQDTDVFNGIAGHEDWAMWDTIIKITAGDNNALGTYNIAVRERDKAEALLKRRVNHMQRTGPLRRRDVAGDSRRERSLLWRRP